MRRPGLVAAILAIVALGAGCAQAASVAPSTAEFGYAGENGPERWGDLDPSWATCETGMEQSPIELQDPRPTSAPDPAFAYVAGRATVTDPGHTITIAVPAGSAMTLDGTTWMLAQLHYHSPGEHRISGAPAAAEWHFVHRDPAGSIAVVAILVDEGAASASWQPVVDAVARAPDDGSQGSIERLDLASLIPRDSGSVRYDGSLTTPPCTQDVRWIVLTMHVTMSAGQLATLRDRYAGNARPVQDLNGREPSADDPDSAG